MRGASALDKDIGLALVDQGFLRGFESFVGSLCVFYVM